MEDVISENISSEEHISTVTDAVNSCQIQSSLETGSKANDGKHPDRPLSPVLNNSTAYRKMIFDRKKCRTRSRVKLSNRFVEQQNNSTEHNKNHLEESHINQIFNDLKDCTHDSVNQRLKKIQKFENEKKKFSECLYNQNIPKNDCQLQTTSVTDDFNFKKPLSPVSGSKKAKPCTDMLLHDRKSKNSLESNLKDTNKIVGKEVLVVPTFIGFCTGAGKNIVVLPENLKKHSEIFSDILDVNQNKSDMDVDHNFLKGRSVLRKNPTKPKNMEISESFSCEFSEVDKQSEAHPKDVLFVHPSISDTQMILAADIAMSMMDLPNDDWAAPIPNTPSDFETKISELNNINSIEKLTDSNTLINADSKVPLVNLNTTLEFEMNELEKVLNTNIESYPEIIEHHIKNDRAQTKRSSTIDDLNSQCMKESLSYGSEQLPKKLNTDGEEQISNVCLKPHVAPDTLENNNTLSDFKGFKTGDYICDLCDNFNKFLYDTSDVKNGKRPAVVNKSRPDLLDMQTKENHKKHKQVTSETIEPERKRFKYESDELISTQTPHKKTDTQLITSSETSDNINFPAGGFRSASGKFIKMSGASLQKAEHIYKQICQTDSSLENIENALKKTKDKIMTEKVHPMGVSTSSGKSTEVLLDKALNKISKVSNLKAPAKEVKLEVQPITTASDIQPMGFSTAGGKNIKVSENALKRAKTLLNQSILKEQNAVTKTTLPENSLHKKMSALKEIEEENKPKPMQSVSFGGFSTANGKNIKISESNLQKARTVFDDKDLFSSSENQMDQIAVTKQTVPENSLQKKISALKEIEQGNKPNPIQTITFGGFSTANGKNIKISESTLQKAKTVFGDDLSSCSENRMDIAVTKKTVPENSLHKNMLTLKEIEEDKLKPIRSISFGGFSTANGKNIKISENTLQKAKAVFGDEDLFSCIENQMDVGDFPVACATSSELPENVPQKVSKLEENSDKQDKSVPAVSSLNTKKLSSELHTSTPKKPLENLNVKGNKQKFGSNLAKKRLGVSSCKQISISNDKLQKAKDLFKDFEENNQSIDSTVASVNTPIKFNPSNIYSSTPLKDANVFKPAIQESLKKVGIVKANSLTDLNITPVKRPQFIEKLQVENKNSPVVIHKQTEGNTENWLELIKKEYEQLEQKLKIVAERKTALEMQKKLLESDSGTHRRQVLGILLGKKQSAQRISLAHLVGNRKPGDTNGNLPQKILEVTPKTAELIHFNSNWQKNLDEQSSVVYSIEGAVLIPNTNDLIGLAEVQAAFKAMPGVDPKLLPHGWTSNHFKWIVWKLASMERSFPDVFAGYLCLENVMQQLKYRYDREIDRAERSALRRILEKDDVPQKRMILCVADIIKVTNMFELELTDGWYSIRTIIDKPLCRQIRLSKIIVGTKLITQCAEIINCEGCHPLEVPNNVRLKISYNCTRRAAWDSKLGYQKIAAPFPICLKTVQPDGGLIGCIKVFIARVYPLRYMERQGGRIVWRNNKADQKRAQEWENQRMKEMETIHQKIQAEYEKDIIGIKKNSVDIMDSDTFSQVTSPSVLCELLENANDPESFRNKFSSSQIASAVEYKRNIYSKQQEELSSRISAEVKKLSSTQRDVCSVLKLLVIDANENSNRGFNFNIWRPTEEHLQILKEGCTFYVFSVVPKLNGDLATTARTHFKLESTSSQNVKLQRHIIPISIVQQSFNKPLFNEYDTVGTVVQIVKNVCYQEIWITDFIGNLLLVKILEGSERCSLLDNINRGQNIVLMNLVFCEPQDNFGQAIANQSTVITSFPQHKFLQSGLETYCEQLPKDLTIFLNDCDKKIDVCNTKAQAMKSSINSSCISTLVDSAATVSTSYGDVFDDSSEDHTLISSRLTTTDVAMSLIDTDQYFENV